SAPNLFVMPRSSSFMCSILFRGGQTHRARRGRLSPASPRAHVSRSVEVGRYVDLTGDDGCLEGVQLSDQLSVDLVGEVVQIGDADAFVLQRADVGGRVELAVRTRHHCL